MKGYKSEKSSSKVIRDGCFRNVRPVSKTPRDYATNPAKGDNSGRGTSPVIGKLG